MTPPPSIADVSRPDSAMQDEWERALGELERLAADVATDRTATDGAFAAAVTRVASLIGRTAHVRFAQRTADGRWSEHPARAPDAAETQIWNARLASVSPGAPPQTCSLSPDTETRLWRCEDDQAGMLLIGATTHVFVEDRAPYLIALAEIAADRQRRAGLRRGQERTRSWAELWNAQRRWSECEDLPGVAQATVEDLRRHVAAPYGFERVALLLDRGAIKPLWRASAVSGATSIDEQSDAARALGRLAAHAATTGRAERYGDVRADGPCDADDGEDDLGASALWHDYVEASATRGLLIVPWTARWSAPASLSDAPNEAGLRETHRLHVALPDDVNDLCDERPNAEPPQRGAWVFETFSGTKTAPSQSGDCVSESVARCWLVGAATAVERARRVDDLPGIGLARLLDVWRRGRRNRGVARRRTALVAAGVLLLAALLIPARFEIVARGRLWPALRKEIFAPEDAVVAQVAVRHGQTVEQGTVLLELTSAELERKRIELRGELRTAEQRLASLRAERLRLTGSSADELARADKLTADEAELTTAKASFDEQLRILERRRESLTVRSPITGRILTWNPDETLAGQPVRRGQAMLTVADPHGAWTAEVRIDEDEIGYVRAAQRATESPLTIDVHPATAPDERLPAELTTLAERSEHDPVWGTGLAATARIGRSSETDALGPGTAATARIPCGRRPLGFVWFRDVIDAWRNW